MKYGRKMKLVDVDNILDESDGKNKSITKLDSKINKILHLNNISSEKKAKLYGIELQKYLFFTKQSRQPKEFKLHFDNKHDHIDTKFKSNEEEEEHKDSQPEFSMFNGEADEENLYESDEYEIKPPKSSTPYKDYSKSIIHSSNPFLSAQSATLQNSSVAKNGHVTISPIKHISKNDTNPFKVKSKLERSAILTRKLVKGSTSARDKLKGWLSLSKQKK